MKPTLFALVVGLASIPHMTAAQTYAETFECTFEPGLAKGLTPTHVLFSIDEHGQAALLHDVKIPEVDTVKRSAEIDRNSFRVLSLSWPGRSYTFTETNRGTRSGDTRVKILDLFRVDFSLFLDRRTMKALVRSTSTRNANLRANAKGNCTPVEVAN